MRLKSTVMRIAFSLSVMAISVCAHSDTVTSVLKNLFGNHMNDIAVPIIDLPQKFHDVYSDGVDFSPDGKYLAGDAENGVIQVWDWANAHITSTLTEPHGSNFGTSNSPIHYSPDGRWLASCSSKGIGEVVVRVWDTKTWAVAADIVDNGPGGCDAMGFTPDGKWLIYAIDRVIKPSEIVVYAVNTWTETWRVQLDLNQLTLAISPDGIAVAVSGVHTTVLNSLDVNGYKNLLHMPTINVVDLQQRKIVKTLPGDVEGPMTWSPDGARIAVENGARYIDVFDAHSGQRLLHEKLVAESGTRNIRFTPDGKYFIESDLNGMGKGLGVSIWDGQRQHLLQEMPLGDVASIGVSRSSKYLAVGRTGRTTIYQLKQ